MSLKYFLFTAILFLGYKDVSASILCFICDSRINPACQDTIDDTVDQQLCGSGNVCVKLSYTRDGVDVTERTCHRYYLTCDDYKRELNGTITNWDCLICNENSCNGNGP